MKEKVNQWIIDNKDIILEDLRTLVEKPSTRTNKTDYPYGDGVQLALEHILSLGEKYGYEVENLDNQVGKIIYNKGADKTLGLWSHLDVVEPGEGWIYSPYEMVLKDGYAIGRGVSDNKGPAVGVLHAMRCLEELNIPIEYNFIGFYGTDEETGFEDLAHYTKNYKAPDLSIVPDTQFPVAFGEKGVNYIDFYSNHSLSDEIVELEGGLAGNIVPPTASATLKDGTVIKGVGNSRHSARPEGAKSAIYDLMVQLLELDTLTDSDREIFTFVKETSKTHFGEFFTITSGDEISGPLTCVATLLSMEDRKLKVTYNIRCPIMVNQNRVYEIMNQKGIKYNFNSNHRMNNTPHYFSGDFSIVELLTDLYNKETGDNKEPYTLAGGTYSHTLPNAIGFGFGMPDTPRPDFLPENHGGAHEPDEFLHLDSYFKGLEITILALIVLNNYMN